MTTLTIDLPEAVCSALRRTPDDLIREMRLTAAATWYSQGRISQEIAARFAGLDRTDFLLVLSRMGIDSFQVDFQDLDRELSRG
ncbi:MAG: UPF0175 family protein [Magnetococcales bacterium]|nr:UPF0175 family protein [Magnetococcales bacterium]